MKKTDKILIGIVGGIIVLVAVAFVVALNKPAPTYQAEGTPEGVAFNYLFALKQKDYERAYGYISPGLKGRPKNVEKFIDDVRDNTWQFNGLDDSSITLEVDSVEMIGSRADVRIIETHFYEGDLFSSGSYTNNFVITLRPDAAGNWKIEDANDYWNPCWDEPASYCK
jgi:hypothetical protein